MPLLLTTLIVSTALVTTAWLLFRYLAEKDRLQHAERKELYTRIQAPEMAPVLSPAPDIEDTSEGYSEEAEVLAIVKGEPR